MTTPPGPIRRIGLVGRGNTPEVAAAVQAVADVVQRRGLELELEVGIPSPPGMTCQSLRQIPDVDLLVTLGGDGTLLRGARMVMAAGGPAGSPGIGIPVLGVNLGHLGFLTAVAAEDAAAGLESVLDGDALLDDRFTLEGVVLGGDGRERARVQALNDLVLHKGGVARVVRLEMAVGPEGELDSIGSFSGDGVILSTPTGSTAYSLSAGGPVLFPTMDALVVTPISPHTMAVRPLVLPAETRLTLHAFDRAEELVITADGQEAVPLAPDDRVVVQKGAKRVRLVRFPGQTFFQTLRRKLNWAI
ncbi:NAD(+)/NADH kinase [soil metagenome]